MKHIWACTCGHEAECSLEDHRLGAVWKCKACWQVWGCVRPRKGGSAWVKISDSDVQFRGLFDEPEPEEEEA